jgi:hypothetical protein
VKAYGEKHRISHALPCNSLPTPFVRIQVRDPKFPLRSPTSHLLVTPVVHPFSPAFKFWETEVLLFSSHCMETHLIHRRGRSRRTLGSQSLLESLVLHAVFILHGLRNPFAARLDAANAFFMTWVSILLQFIANGERFCHRIVFWPSASEKFCSPRSDNSAHAVVRSRSCDGRLLRCDSHAVGKSFRHLSVQGVLSGLVSPMCDPALPDNADPLGLDPCIRFSQGRAKTRVVPCGVGVVDACNDLGFLPFAFVLIAAAAGATGL